MFYGREGVSGNGESSIDENSLYFLPDDLIGDEEEETNETLEGSSTNEDGKRLDGLSNRFYGSKGEERTHLYGDFHSTPLVGPWQQQQDQQHPVMGPLGRVSDLRPTAKSFEPQSMNALDWGSIGFTNELESEFDQPLPSRFSRIDMGSALFQGSNSSLEVSTTHSPLPPPSAFTSSATSRGEMNRFAVNTTGSGESGDEDLKRSPVGYLSNQFQSARNLVSGALTSSLFHQRKTSSEGFKIHVHSSSTFHSASPVQAANSGLTSDHDLQVPSHSAPASSWFTNPSTGESHTNHKTLSHSHSSDTPSTQRSSQRKQSWNVGSALTKGWAKVLQRNPPSTSTPVNNTTTPVVTVSHHHELSRRTMTRQEEPKLHQHRQKQKQHVRTSGHKAGVPQKELESNNSKDKNVSHSSRKVHGKFNLDETATEEKAVEKKAVEKYVAKQPKRKRGSIGPKSSDPESSLTSSKNTTRNPWSVLDIDDDKDVGDSSDNIETTPIDQDVETSDLASTASSISPSSTPKSLTISAKPETTPASRPDPKKRDKESEGAKKGKKGKGAKKPISPRAASKRPNQVSERPRVQSSATTHSSRTSSTTSTAVPAENNTSDGSALNLVSEENLLDNLPRILDVNTLVRRGIDTVKIMTSSTWTFWRVACRTMSHAFVQAHVLAWQGLTGRGRFLHTAVCYLTLQLFAPFVQYVLVNAPPWPQVCVWYAFLLQYLWLGNESGSKAFFRCLVPIMFVLEGVSHPCFLLELNGGELMVISFVVLVLGDENVQLNLTLMVLLSVQTILALLVGGNLLLQWTMLISQLGFLCSPVYSQKESQKDTH